jgi:hypothetical protein
MYAPHDHAQHPCHRVLSVACPGLLTVPQGGMSAPPAVKAQTSWFDVCGALLVTRHSPLATCHCS